MAQSDRNYHKAPAVVAGLDTLQGLQTARILARHQIPVIGVVKNPSNFYGHTGVCQQIVHANTKSDELIGALESLGSDLDEKAVLFPCTDMTVLTVTRHMDRLKPYYHLMLPDPEIVEMLLDKYTFYDYAQREGFAVPKTVFVLGPADIEKAVSTLDYPIVLKPAVKTPKWEQYAASSAYKVADETELREVYRQCAGWADILIAQEHIPGGEGELYALNCYMTADSEPAGTFISRKIRQWPPQTGNGCLREASRNDEVLEESLRLLKRVNYRGMVYVEAKRHAVTGKHFIIEANVGRPTGGSAIAEAGGVNLLYAMYCEAVGLPIPPKTEQQDTPLKWINFVEDVRSAYFYWRNGDLTLIEWIQSVRGHKMEAMLSLRDPGPMISMVRQAIIRNLPSPLKLRSSATRFFRLKPNSSHD